MTYRGGSLPGGHHGMPSGFTGQPMPPSLPQHHPQHQYHQPQSQHVQYTQPVYNGFDPSYSGFQNATFQPYQYSQQPQQQQQQHQHQQQRSQQPQPMPAQQHHQPMQPQNATYHMPHQQPNQFPSYDASFDPRRVQASPTQNGSPSPMMPRQAIQQHSGHPQATRPQYHQQMDWQHMPPPISNPMSMPQYQSPAPQPQSPFQHQNQAQSVPRHTSSPVVAPSPQLAPQFSPVPAATAVASAVTMNNGGRSASIGARFDQSGVHPSPRLATAAVTRSPSVSSTRSPAPGLVPHHTDTNSLLVCVAEELLEKARNESASVGDSLDAKGLQDYHKLIATGLGCLEVVLASSKLDPRLEARLQLRYASIICEETNNLMASETALTKGIALCERNRFPDLKYLMQFLQVRMLSQRRGKAALIALDRQIKEADVQKHTHWVYAFRFLKASLYLQSASPADAPALENLRAITTLANMRNDQAVFVLASLLEGLSLLKAMKDDAIVRIQNCIAQAAKYQFEGPVQIMQLEILALMLDLACSLRQKSPPTISIKVKALTDRLDAFIKDPQWGLTDNQLILPIRKQSSGFSVISEDTSAILRPGAANEPWDYLVLSFWSKYEAFTVSYTFSGIGHLYQMPRNDRKMFSLWEEAHSQLIKNGYRIRGVPASLPAAVQGADWRREVKCYIYILRGLHCTTLSKWAEAQHCVEQLETTIKPPLVGIIGSSCKYLSAVVSQGMGDLPAALSMYSDPTFNLDALGPGSRQISQAESDLVLLAALNRICIMQHPDYRDDRLTNDLLDQLRPYCTEHASREISMSYTLVLAAIQTNPPIPMTAVKTHISTTLNGAKALGDTKTIAITLCLMQAKLFQGIVGAQALKSARAAAQQAKRSGSTLWMSVADAMLASSLEVQGLTEEAWNARQEAERNASLQGFS